MPAPLPPAKDVGLDNIPNALSAYNICLALEKKANTAEHIMDARILGYLVLHAPSSTGLVEVVWVIHSYSQDEKKLLVLGECFRLWFIRPFKKFKGKTPATSESHPSRPSFDKVRADLKTKILEAPKDYKEAKAQALIRDGHKCVVTEKYDFLAETESIVSIDAILAAGGGAVHTELAHILPQAVYAGTSSSEHKLDYASLVLAVMQHFGFDVDKVNGPKVHSLFNVMTMEQNVHDWFDRLALWFEATDVPNCYRVKTIKASYGPVPHEVTFTSPDPVVLPYPSPQLLALHAACAKVAHLSGAGEYIDKFDRDADDMDVLASDGSSPAVLEHALLRLMLHPIDTAA